MDEYEVKDFSEVWDRVAAADSQRKNDRQKNGGQHRNVQNRGNRRPEASPPAPPSDGGDELCGFIAGEMSSRKWYAAMAKRSRRGSAIFRRLFEEETVHLRRLRTVQFISKGECPPPNVPEVRVTSFSEALRTIFNAETAASKAYAAAAGSSQDEKLAAIYKELAADEARHAEIIEKLIYDMMR